MTNRLKKPDSALIKIIVIVLPAVIVFLIYCFRNSLIFFGSKFPACPSYTYLNIYCPGCGNTRSVQRLLAGDVAGSIKYNPIPLLGIILIILTYIELLAGTINKPVKLVPRSKRFWTVFTVCLIIYFIIRNFIKIF